MLETDDIQVRSEEKNCAGEEMKRTSEKSYREQAGVVALGHSGGGFSGVGWSESTEWREREFPGKKT